MSDSLAAQFVNYIMATRHEAPARVVTLTPGDAPAPRRHLGRAPGPTTAPPKRRLSNRHKSAKGSRLQREARDYFTARGALVETAQKKMLIFPDRKTGQLVRISRKHDYFGLWDLIVVWPDGRRHLVQVTTLDHVSHKRQEILASGFPVTPEDLILGHERGRTFRILRGPGFEMGEERT